MPESLTTGEFVQRWAGRKLTERASAQPHFNDLCHMLGVPTPTDNPVTDSDYGFEAVTDVSASGVYATTSEDGLFRYQVKTGPGKGFVDVWKREHFCWEYKRPVKHANLAAALAQVKIYKDYLGNPPLLIVCDIDRFEIHTNFTNYPPEVYRFTINDLVNPSDDWHKSHPDIAPLAVLRKVWEDVEWFRPAKTTAAITEKLAGDIGEVAKSLRDAGNEPHAVAHFLMQIVFCMFAEDIGLLPRDIFTKIIESSIDEPDTFPAKARNLFEKMESGGHFGVDKIEWFNGGLFKDIEAEPIIKIASPLLGRLLLAAKADWNSIEPSILGTLFERSLDPDKRSQIGAHYTSRDDIMLIIEPVVMQPLKRKWVDVQKDVAEWLEQREALDQTQKRKKANLSKKIEKAIIGFVDHLGSIRILDPACGSGNFLYVAIQQLLELEHQVRAFSTREEVSVEFLPRVNPGQLHGIEINDYAAELARVSIWIGYLQWLYRNEDSPQKRPILDPLDTIECRDAILTWKVPESDENSTNQETAICRGKADWPEVDFIIGNPPFLGGSLIWDAYGTEYRDELWTEYDLPNFSDLCCYWFEQGRIVLRKDLHVRIGLLATQAIRGKTNRTVLERIKVVGDIFMAWADREWILDGAAVHVSMIGFDNGGDNGKFLNGVPTTTINADLTSGLDLTVRKVLSENLNIAYIGTKKAGDFDIDWTSAHKLLKDTGNPHHRLNNEVLFPWVNGGAITKRDHGKWIIDFGTALDIEDASKYELPFKHVEHYVKPERAKNKRDSYRRKWWLHAEPRPGLRREIDNLSRYLATSRIAKHRVFRWVPRTTLPDDGVFIFAHEDDYLYGLLHSSLHIIWANRMGTQLESRPRYTPTTCFETYPFPWSSGNETVNDSNFCRLSEIAKELDALRENWLNPQEWIEQIEDAVDRFEDFSDVHEDTRELLRQSAINERAAKDKRLKKRTLTNLYNERPGWLRLNHKKLDEAVINAYASVDPAGDWDPAWAEAYEPFGAGEITIVENGKNKDSKEVIEAKQAAIEKRKEVDQKILANLLRMNLERAKADSGNEYLKTMKAL